MDISGFISVPLTYNMLEKFSLTIADSLQRVILMFTSVQESIC